MQADTTVEAPIGKAAAPGILRIPGWDRFSWLRAGFSTRLGGLSAVYGPGEQNLGWTREDDPAIVASNRAAFVAAIGDDAPLRMVTSRQVHGKYVRVLESEPEPWMDADGKALHDADGMITGTPGQLLAVLTADCVPVLVADTRLRAVGAFHAGWRGTLARIAESGVQQMQAQYGSRVQDLVAAIGPCIRACCFEVGEEIREAFHREDPGAAELFPLSGNGAKPRMDLVRANELQLRGAGVLPENIAIVGGCTACSRTPGGRRRFFSHRAERGLTGRMLSAIAALNG